MHTDQVKISELVLGAVFEVANTLKSGFLEKVYERALMREFALRGISAEAQVSLPVFYKEVGVGHFLADIVVDGQLMVELKCVEQFAGEHYAQCLNYLRASGLKICLLINFQKPKVEWKRISM